jgi:ankyrin repeat protein
MSLTYASHNGNLKIVKELIKAGTNVNSVTDNDTTPLMYASSRGHLEIVKELIKAGAYVNIFGNYNNTALMLASEYGHLDIVKYLIRNGAYVNTFDKYRMTPLMLASEYGYFKIVKELIKTGADVKVVDDYNNTALMYASAGGHSDIVKYLREQQLKVYTTKTGQKQGHQKNLRVIRALPGGTDYQKAMDRFNKINMKFNKFGKIKISSKNRKNAKKYKVRLTVNKNGKRVYKTNNVLEGQIKRKMK